MKAFLSTSEVGAHMGVSSESIRRRCRDGLVPGAVRVGHPWDIPAKFVLDAMGIEPVDRLRMINGEFEVGSSTTEDLVVEATLQVVRNLMLRGTQT